MLGIDHFQRLGTQSKHTGLMYSVLRVAFWAHNSLGFSETTPLNTQSRDLTRLKKLSADQCRPSCRMTWSRSPRGLGRWAVPSYPKMGGALRHRYYINIPLVTDTKFEISPQLRLYDVMQDVIVLTTLERGALFMYFLKYTKPQALEA